MTRVARKKLRIHRHRENRGKLVRRVIARLEGEQVYAGVDPGSLQFTVSGRILTPMPRTEKEKAQSAKLSRRNRHETI